MKSLPAINYERPTTVAEACRLLAGGGTAACAGGTDVLGCLRAGVGQIHTVVSMSRLAALRGIKETAGGGLRIGALATLRDVVSSPIVRERYAALSQAAAAVGTPQLRAQGTVGGNLCQRPRCWYLRNRFDCLRAGGGSCYAAGGENRYHAILGAAGCAAVHPSDLAPALMAFDAQLRIAGPLRGSRLLPLSSFFVPPDRDLGRENVLRAGELLVEVLLPPPPAGARSAFRKIRERQAWDFALASLAAVVVGAADRVIDARIVLGGAAPVPWRSREAEQALIGRSLKEPAVEQAARLVVAAAQPLEQNGYKLPLFQGLVHQVLPTLA